DRADHIAETGAFGAGRGGNLSGDTSESVGGVTHRAFVTPRISRNAFHRDRVLDVVISRATEQRSETFFFADSSEDFGAAHREVGFFEWDFCTKLELIGNLDWAGCVGRF